MEPVFCIVDKSGRKIRLTEKQWKHITKTHSDIINYLENIKEILRKPIKITDYSFDEDVRYYYDYLKHKNNTNKYMVVVVKYLNGDGFVITSHFRKNIK